MDKRVLAVAAIASGAFAVRANAQSFASDRLEAMMIAADVNRARDPGPMPLVEERLAVTIDGQHASTTLLQVWQNTTPGQAYGVSYVMVTYVFIGDRPAAPPRGGQR